MRITVNLLIIWLV